MKLVKLSLVAAAAASTFSVANATSMDEVVKDIDVSGMLRYRYDTGLYHFGGLKGNVLADSNGEQISSPQYHKYRAQLNLQGSISDNFKAFVQFDYSATDGGYGPNSVVSVSQDMVNVRQLYLTYTDDLTSTSIIAGRQQIDSIWTDNGIDGLVGTGIKAVNTSVAGLTVQGFTMDSLAVYRNYDNIIGIPGLIPSRGDGDFTQLFSRGDANYPYDIGNLYGLGVLGSYEILGGDTFKPQVWLAYWENVGGFYAVDASYNLPFGENASYNGEVAYLGNNNSKKNKTLESPNFIGLRGTVKAVGADLSLGWLMYGNKDKYSLTTIEDQGNIGSILAGQEIFYSNGSHLNGDTGQNNFGYVTAGYTFAEVFRVGADYVFGGTKTGALGMGAKKWEAVARLSYDYTPKLNFSAFYSYLQEEYKNDRTIQVQNLFSINEYTSKKLDHQAIRFQALYKF